MRYYHKLGDEAVVESESTSFLIAREQGGYISFGLPNVTRYQGLCALLPWGTTWEMFKTLESISIDDNAESIVLLPDAVERVFSRAIERISVQTGSTIYELRHYTGSVRITLDMRQIHDFEAWGRHYNVLDVPGGHVITYSCPRYSFCLAILGAKAEWKPQWREVTYNFDRLRQSRDTFHVIDCLEYQCEQTLTLRFGIGYTPQDAIAQANNSTPQPHQLTSPSREPSMQAAVAALDGVLTSLPHLELGILAGYPWFYQVYNRDEAISLGALIALGHIDHAKAILLRSLKATLPDGRIANRFPTSEIGSADGVGWTYLRASELLERSAFTNEELKFVQRQLSVSVEQLERHHMQGGLVTNAWKETWMDTTGGSEDGRDGARIEIQALTLRMYSLLAAICRVTGEGDAVYYEQKLDLLHQAVRIKFLDEHGVLADGVSDHVDKTARPNVFLACYAYPDILSYDEWRRVFVRTIEKLWLPWGGFSTISKEHLLFQPYHTGEQDKSYHRGDSWYFLNNFAAICLLKYGFNREAEAIYSSSRTQLLSMGIPGHAAEISSAQKQEALGCFSQAWSAATFVELFLARQAAARQS